MATNEILRKVLLSVLLMPAAPLAHVWFGHEYRGPGMNQISVLIVTVAVGVAALLLFDVLSVAAHFLAKRREPSVRSWCDVAIFGVLFVVSVAAGLSAKVS